MEKSSVHQKKPILVTGATGFVGRHLLERLVHEEDVQPLALVRNLSSWEQPPWTRNLGSVEVLTGSVLSTESWRNDPRLNNLAGIFHLAALIQHSRESPEEMYRTNIEGLLQMVRVAHHAQTRIVFVSTSGTVGCFERPDTQADEHSPYCDQAIQNWPYYDSKLKAEKAARALATELGVRLVIVRPPILLGPGDHRGRATSHILRLLKGQLPFIVRGGFHFVDIRDAVEALIRVMFHPDPKPVYHLSGTSCSIDAFFQMVAHIAGLPPPKRHLPAALARVLASTTANLEKILLHRRLHLLPDPVVFEMASRHWNTRSLYAERDLGFKSRDPVTTLRDTIQWLVDQDEEVRDKLSFFPSESGALVREVTQVRD